MNAVPGIVHPTLAAQGWGTRSFGGREAGLSTPLGFGRDDNFFQY
jgi:hypothetical protein